MYREILISFTLVLYFGNAASSQPVQFLRTLSEPGSTSFGIDLADFNGNLLVGATYGDVFQARSGRAFLVNPNTGVRIREFVNPSPQSGDFFGRSVSAFGDRVAVGAPGGTANPGGDVYLFSGSTGSSVGIIPGGSQNDRFGWSLSSANNKLYVGTPEFRTALEYNGNGRVHSYTNTLAQNVVQNPQPGGATDEESFGYSVAATNNGVFVGALHDNDGGKVWHMSESGSILRTYDNPDGPLGNGGSPQFGVSVDALGSILLIGANQSSASPSRISATGAAYLFDNTNGNLLFKLFDPTPGVLDNFGISVALFPDYAVIGAHSDDDGHSRGAAFVYDVRTGAHIQTIESPFATSDNFGLRLSRVGNDLLAISEVNSSTHEGFVHIYSIGVPEPGVSMLILFAMGTLAFSRNQPRFLATERETA